MPEVGFSPRKERPPEQSPPTLMDCRTACSLGRSTAVHTTCTGGTGRCRRSIRPGRVTVRQGSRTVDSLLCRAEGIDGIIPPELTDAVNACGGAEKWRDCVARCVDQLEQQPGGSLFNWFKLGSAGGGPYGVCCLTCGSKSTTLGGGQSTSSPFNNFVFNHLRSRKHEKTRDALYSLESRLVAGPEPKSPCRSLPSVLDSCRVLSCHLRSCCLWAPSLSARPARAAPRGAPSTIKPARHQAGAARHKAWRRRLHGERRRSPRWLRPLLGPQADLGPPQQPQLAQERDHAPRVAQPPKAGHAAARVLRDQGDCRAPL